MFEETRSKRVREKQNLWLDTLKLENSFFCKDLETLNNRIEIIVCKEDEIKEVENPKQKTSLLFALIEFINILLGLFKRKK